MNQFLTFFRKIFSPRKKEFTPKLRSEYSDLLIHPHFNPIEFRIVLPRDQLLSLPIRKINHDQLKQLQKTVTFNPCQYYSEVIPLLFGELGHDLEARYVLEGCQLKDD